jgi:hypothetical protein
MSNIDDDDDLFETIIGHDGKPVRVLRDGRRWRVPLTFLDGVQRAIALNGRARVRAADNDLLSLHRPGARFLADDTVTDAAAIAYDEMKREQANAWRRGPQQQYDAGPPVGSYGPFEARRIGQPCTVDGQPGTLVASADGKWLLCQRSSRSGADSVPRSEMSLADAEAIKQQAYDEMRAAQRDAWRHPGSAW